VLEVGSLKSEVRSRKSEVGSGKSEVGVRWEDFQTSDDRKTWKRQRGWVNDEPRGRKGVKALRCNWVIVPRLRSG
jgi:hypothetical protein